jgi:hypothetical protein
MPVLRKSTADWQEVVSPDGVRCLFARLPQREPDALTRVSSKVPRFSAFILHSGPRNKPLGFPISLA